MKHSTKVYFFVVILLIVETKIFVECANSGSRTTSKPKDNRAAVQTLNVEEISKRDETDPRNAKTMHPVSRLYLIQAKQQQMEPIFKEVGKRNYRNHDNKIVRHEFQMQVKVGDKTASEWGQTKKDAKRRASITMLKLMGLQVENEHF